MRSMVALTGRRRHCQYYFSDAASRNLDFPGNGNAAGATVRASWSTGDSAAQVYAERVIMHEYRNVRQVAEVIARLLPT
jgi:hypothetical protein